MASMPMSDAIEAGCKLVGPPQRAWWFDRDGRMLLTDDVTMVATGACVLATAVVGRAGSLARAQQLVLVGTLKLRETLGKAWPFLNEKVPVSEQACPTKGVCFPRPTEAWDWWHELQHMSDRHKVSREDIALRLRAAGK